MLLVILLLLLLAAGIIAGGLLTLLILERPQRIDPWLAAFRARREIAETERQAIQQLLATAQVLRQSTVASPPHTSSADVIEGTATEVDSEP